MDDFDITQHVFFDKDDLLEKIDEYNMDPNDPKDAIEIFLIEMRLAKDKQGKLVYLNDDDITKIAISRGLITKEDAESKFCNICKQEYRDSPLGISITEKFRHQLDCN